MSEAWCPECGHPWGSHQGRSGGQQCVYGYASAPRCPCRRMNPEVAAEDRRAAGLWNAYMGRKPAAPPAPELAR